MAIDVNSASKDELTQLNGIGEELADTIIRARPFRHLGDLIAVKGVGRVTLKKLAAQGLAIGKGAKKKMTKSDRPVPRKTAKGADAMSPALSEAMGAVQSTEMSGASGYEMAAESPMPDQMPAGPGQMEAGMEAYDMAALADSSMDSTTTGMHSPSADGMDMREAPVDGMDSMTNGQMTGAAIGSMGDDGRQAAGSQMMTGLSGGGMATLSEVARQAIGLAGTFRLQLSVDTVTVQPRNGEE